MSTSAQSLYHERTKRSIPGLSLSPASLIKSLDYSRAKANPPHPCIKRIDEEAACEGG